MSKLGVIIGRFQTDNLHAGHVNLIQTVQNKCETLLILLGCSSARVTRKNPLDYETRALMIKEAFPCAIVQPLHDRKQNEVWSKQVDGIIKDVLDYLEISEATLYGSRDSFIPHYSGNWPTEELLQGVELEGVAASLQRAYIADHPRNNLDFRAGVIYASQQMYPKTHPTVDIAIFNDDYTKILLGRKHLETQFRFIGGFVDPTDANLEAAAKREVGEECGDIETDDYQYVASMLINDWRYRSEVDKIMTTLFTCKYIFGTPQGGDDIAEVVWVDFKDLNEEDLVTEHGKLLEVLRNDVNWKRITSRHIKL